MFCNVDPNRPEKNEAWLAAKAQEPGVTPLDGGIYYKVLKSGHKDSRTPIRGSVVTVHYTGKTINGKTHHLVSSRIVCEDMWLRDWFSEEQIETMAQACEDHRASSDHEPRSIYGKIVAEADRFIDSDTIILRTLQYGLANYPELDK